MTHYNLCDECTTAVVNNDWTHLDFHEYDEDERATQLANVEAMGNVTLDTDADADTSYRYCWVCSFDTLDFNLFTRDTHNV